MQSKTDEFVAELEVYDIEERHLSNVELYEEYSKRTIVDTIERSKENFRKSGFTIKKELLAEVESEVKNFRTWLEETKNLDPAIAYYYAVSLKSLLLGLQMGVQAAQLFDIILDKHARK
jgi:hypothetical protein